MDSIDDFEKFHPKAVKLLRERRNFLVVANNEPYFRWVYAIIRASEQSKGTWTSNDELNYQLWFSLTDSEGVSGYG